MDRELINTTLAGVEGWTGLFLTERGIRVGIPPGEDRPQPLTDYTISVTACMRVARKMGGLCITFGHDGTGDIVLISWWNPERKSMIKEDYDNNPALTLSTMLAQIARER